MRVLVLTPYLYDTSPGNRFRIEQWARHLDNQGFDFTFVPFMDTQLQNIIHQPGKALGKLRLMAKAYLRYWKVISGAAKFDVVYLFREAALLGPPLLEYVLTRQKVPIVYDFDDAIWLKYVSPTNKYLSYLKFPGKTSTICRLSNHVTVGNEYLASYALKRNRNVTILPTTIDTEMYTATKRQNSDQRDPIVIGWTGSHSTIQHLNTARDSLLRTFREHPFHLLVIGADSYHLGDIPIGAHSWRAATEVADLQQIDIGIMPLPDDEWSQGKCGLKLLQYMALGIPAIASPVGVNTQIIHDGVNGMLAASEDEWVEKLSNLIQDASLRRHIGQAGRRTVEDRYSAAVWAPRFGQILHKVAVRS